MVGCWGSHAEYRLGHWGVVASGHHPFSLLWQAFLAMTLAALVATRLTVPLGETLIRLRGCVLVLGWGASLVQGF